MSVGPISAVGLSQNVLSSSDSTGLQQVLQTLQNSLALGDVNGAQAAFTNLQNLIQGLAIAGGSLSSNSQFSTDLTALGSALTAGNLTTAQSAFTTVKSDLSNSNSPSLANETAAASQSVQLVNELLSTLSVNSTPASNATDSTTSVLESVYGNPSNLNVLA
jgi:hypothetical protein